MPVVDKKETNKLKFHSRLVLNKYMLSLFGVDSFEKLAEGLKDPKLEGLTEENKTRFFISLSNRRLVPENVGIWGQSNWGEFDWGDGTEYITRAQLEKYDQNIVRHTLTIQGKHDHEIKWKYFQYLSLLFTEIYLDKYFTNSLKLLADLNAYVEEFNIDKGKADKVDLFELKDLTKVAFWNATGSGKTYIMHVNIMQYKHYLRLHGKDGSLNKVILLTPNEGLSYQHLQEFELSELKAEIFQKEKVTVVGSQVSVQSNIFAMSKDVDIEIIEITKLKDEDGEKTVAIDAFEGNNLVLVDEGHRGASGTEWKRFRDKLSEDGFSFEYSATFGQAVAGTKLEHEYAKSILFDYSYKFFFNDGYGKDYNILNLPSDTHYENLYLTACLLSFYQQQKVFADKKDEFVKFNHEKPLLVFVGGSVTKTVSKDEMSDVVKIVSFINYFIKNKDEVTGYIKQLTNGCHGLMDKKGVDIIGNRFHYLIKIQLAPEQIYKEILQDIFHGNDGNKLRLENLKGIDGEIGLKLGDGDKYFGVINVGDDTNLLKLCAEKIEGLITEEKDFSQSLFKYINKNDSTINLLIGSRKFTEGWNSWRVSTMGLMKIGQKEGSQIIQLFGRGVRLKGYKWSLKRSNRNELVKSPDFIEKVETLNIFGIKADYMDEFKKYLQDEGLPTDNREEFILPVMPNVNLNNIKLKYPTLKDGVSFKRQGDKPTIDIPSEDLKKRKVVLDLYPKLQSISSDNSGLNYQTKEEHYFTSEHLAFLDYDAIFFELQNFKNQKNWYNLNISNEKIAEILSDRDWYTLLIPDDQMSIDNFEKVIRWQEIAITLMKKYCEKYYNNAKADFEKDKLEFKFIDNEDKNMVPEYKFFIEESQNAIIEKLKQIEAELKAGTFVDYQGFSMNIFNFDNHLYKPLVHLSNTSMVSVSPVNLNDGEKDLVQDLKEFYEKNKTFLESKELYLLRNQGRGRGLGFFDANNFYPDFIMWILDGDKQYITFIDPKGVRNIDGGLQNPKIQFYKTVKEIEGYMKDPNVTFNSFIISNTSYGQISWWKEDSTQIDFEEHNILFQNEDDRYIQKMIGKILG